jgi:hypothetical protein
MPPLCRRFEWVLQNLFGNSITLMAAALGVPHASLSRVINHGQLPSAEMILGLARVGRVNLDWLLGGDDAPPTSARSAGTFLPVSDRLLPGPPSASPELLPPLGLPTASPFNIRDAYWHRVPAGSPIVARDVGGEKGDKGRKDDGWQVRPGDLLLIEAGPAWTARASAFAGRLVVLRHPGRPDGFFARVAADEEFLDDGEFSSPHHKLDSFGLYPEADLFVESARPTPGPRESVEGRPDRRPSFYMDDVVGVVLEKRVLIGTGRR